MSTPFGLPWLLPAPPDFKVRAHAALISDSLDEGEVRKLSAHSLGLDELRILGNVMNKHRDSLIREGGLAPFRMGIVSSHTMQYVAAALPGTALRHNLVLDVVLARSGESAKETLIANSELGRAQLDAILVALDYRALGLAEAQLTPEDADIAIRVAIDLVSEYAEQVRDVIGTTCILQTLVPPASPLFGSFDARIPGSVRAMIERFNEKLVHEVARQGDLVLDVAFLASTVGLSTWNDARDWHNAKLPGALDSTPLYADHICRLLGAARGRDRKCLVLDLDNTLWGGAIGNDAIEEIRVDHGSSGEARIALQQYVLELRRRGTVLAVCARGEDTNARLPFRKDPDMVLKEHHIAVFVANRSDKASNIRQIAAMLNFDTDAVVFLNDNPSERALVRNVLPEVAVPELTADPADYIGLLSAAGYFEATQFSREDLNRAGSYQLNAQWASLQESRDQEEELKALDMVATVSYFKPASRSQISRLINESHQYNLTNARYLERDIEALETAADKFCIQISLTDRLGDYGLISVVIFHRGPQEWVCETWLTSRVHERRVAELALSIVAQYASAASASRLVGTYLPTRKNAMMAGHFDKLDFTQRKQLPGNGTEWVLDLATYEAPALPFKVIRPNGLAHHTTAAS